MQNPADAVQPWPIGRLKPFERNARTHSDAQIAQLVASIREWGWTVPVLATTDGTIIAGHGRVRAAQALGMAEVPVMVADGWTDAQVRAYVLADNKLAANAGWDEELLAVELDELRDLKFDMALMGFAPGELNDLIGTPNTGFDPDETPPAPVVPVSRTGDLWVLGKHRLLCGDATNAEDVARLMGGARANLCFTSPPYAQQREYTNAITDWDGLMQGVFAQLPMHHDGQVLVNLGLVHHDGEVFPYWQPWVDWMRAQGWRHFGWYVWDKISATFKANDGRLWVSHEWVFHFNKNAVPCVEWVECKHAGEQRGGLGQRKPDGHVAALSTPGPIKSHKPPDSVIRVQRETNNTDESVRSHPARFPVEFAQYVQRTFPGRIYEPFCGSGTSVIAAEGLNRPCYGMEIAPQYVDVSVLRWQAFTGREAKLDGDGRTFEEVKRERTPPDTDAAEAGERHAAQVSG